MNNDIETLATALYVKIDDMLKDRPDLAPARPEAGIPPTLSDAELLTMAVMSALLGFRSEHRWLRYVNKYLAGMFPRRIGQSGYNKRIRKAFLHHHGLEDQELKGTASWFQRQQRDPDLVRL